MSDAPQTITRRALRVLRIPLVVTAFGLVGVVLRPGSDDAPASAAQKRAALDLIECRSDLCYGSLRGPASQCVALTGCDGCDATADTQGCPGDASYVAPAAGGRLARLLHCARREGALTAWHADPVLPGNPCPVSLLWTRPQARAWVERLDAASSTAMVSNHLASIPADFKRGAARAHTWAGVPPDADGDDLADGGTLDDGPLPSVDGGP